MLVAGLMFALVAVVLYYAANNYARSTPYFSGSSGVPAVVAVVVLIVIATLVPVMLHRRK